MIGDGSCFFHAIAYAYYIPYRLGHIDGVPMDRRSFVRNLRRDLSHILEEPSVEGGPMIYDMLCRGHLRKFSEGYENYSLDNMKKELKSSYSVDGGIYIELISNLLDKDIYILDSGKRDVYVLGDYDLYYKKRSSIVLLYTGDHYDLVGLQDSDGIKTLFSPRHPFIRAIQHRLLSIK